MEGNAKVTCGRNGRWVGDFPRCKKIGICPFETTMKRDYLIYEFSGKIIDMKDLNNKKISAYLGSLVNYSCVSPDNRKLLIGSSLRFCTDSGKWSGTQPYC